MFHTPGVLKYADNSLKGLIHGAIVVNNDDSQTDTPNRQKIQFRQSGLHTGVTNEQLPWALPSIKAPSGFAGGGSISIPTIGSAVWIYLAEDNDDHPYYIGDSTIGGMLPTELLVDYPNAYGFIDAVGNLFLTNMKQQTTTTWMATGQQLQYLKNGGINVILKGGPLNQSITGAALNISVSGGPINMSPDGQPINMFSGGGNINMNAGGGEINLDGSMINLNQGGNAAAAVPTLTTTTRTAPTPPPLPDVNY